MKKLKPNTWRHAGPPGGYKCRVNWLCGARAFLPRLFKADKNQQKLDAENAMVREIWTSPTKLQRSFGLWGKYVSAPAWTATSNKSSGGGPFKFEFKYKWICLGRENPSRRRSELVDDRGKKRLDNLELASLAWDVAGRGWIIQEWIAIRRLVRPLINCTHMGSVRPI